MASHSPVSSRSRKRVWAPRLSWPEKPSPRPFPNHRKSYGGHSPIHKVVGTKNSLVWLPSAVMTTTCFRLGNAALLETNASRVPSGDHTGLTLSPLRGYGICCGALVADPCAGSNATVYRSDVCVL